jgi:outer membrane receptor protein involved in Fe transport
MQKKIVLAVIYLVFPILIFAQFKAVTLSGKVVDANSKTALPYTNIILKTGKDSAFVSGTITNDEGMFSFVGLKPGNYHLEANILGYQRHQQNVLIGQLSAFLDLGNIQLSESTSALGEVVVSAKQAEISSKMDKKTYSVADNISQSGGSVLQALSNLPSVTVGQDGKVQLRGSEKVAVLIDGKQTSLTGFDAQKGLDNIPASAIERIEIINNPSAKYDANGNAGIINIIFKKNDKQGFNGSVGMAGGLGTLWLKRDNLPTIRPAFQKTPKINPSIALNYRKKKVNVFFQGDWLYTETLNKNEFSERIYDDGTTIFQQVKRNRTTTYATAKTGMDYQLNTQNSISISGLFNREKIDDRGDNPYFRNDFSQRYRLWQFIEDEVKYTASASTAFTHKFIQPGHSLQVNGNYYFHREDEKYFFTNILENFTGTDAFKLLSDEHVFDLNLDYAKPLKQGRLETGFKLRRRAIPVNMQFFAGVNSPIDTNAGGWANYYETIPAVYGNYVYETQKIEIEGGLRTEYVQVNYDVNPNHNTYKSDGYAYFQPFPTLRFAYKMSDSKKISLFYNRRVDRPNEVDIRIFPKYDEPELIKVGNPTLQPQFTNTIELAYKTLVRKGSLYGAVYHRIIDGTITRIATQVPGNLLLYNIFQNAGRSYNTGLELIFQHQPAKWVSFTTSANLYQNTINAFTVTNKYPVPTIYSNTKQQRISGNIKLNTLCTLRKGLEAQSSLVYLAPDIIPQGSISARYGLDFGIKKAIQHGKGNIFLNATDILYAMRIKKEIVGNGFVLRSADFYETQVVRIGYGYKW